MDIAGIILSGLFAPAILFFALGMLSVIVKSDMVIPNSMSTAMAMFLMAAIGLGGGSKAVKAVIAQPGILGAVIVVALVAVICGIFFAVFTAKVMKKIVGLSTADSWACAGHYGAVSSATIAVGIGIASAAQAQAPAEFIYGGWMAAIYPFMDSTALVTAILLGKMALAREGSGSSEATINTKEILHHTLFGMAVWLLVCSLIIGALAEYFSPVESERTLDFFNGMFRGILALFMLDMGMQAAKQLSALRDLGKKLIAAVGVAIVLPQVWGVISIMAMYLIYIMMPGTLGWGDAFVFATIGGGCSFVTAPAAMRIAMPEANPSIYLPMSVALTFPANIVIGMTVWQILCRHLWGVV